MSEQSAATTPGSEGGSPAAPSAAVAAAAWESLFRAQVALMRRFTREDVWGPLSVQEYDVLFALSRAEGRTLRLRDIHEHGLLTQPSVSRLVDRLERRGWVTRGPVAGDARGVAVTLTDAGLELQREVGRRHVRSIQRLVGGALDRDELLQLQDLTQRLRAAQADLPDA
ncbi:MarR family winged helix-turn-helix transcriptional regulator [Cellulomonas marina]|uniref:DNA-binding transcriptional regulator, MarR family n=1 Tax=Cellulomonas marina TaxID=988821 RepID=A0A1I0X1S3_9CELL|nr:MarR family winged helix-turn-helix transcriptional regulator [Cellulomonas marina]GIG29347.1 MarR family transcriptional regulator [Cellulomonas marina]SFA94328.1 DNA-binding transcriptional regulator, MarR family [Cellulomonas marina]